MPLELFGSYGLKVVCFEVEFKFVLPNFADSDESIIQGLGPVLCEFQLIQCLTLHLWILIHNQLKL